MFKKVTSGAALLMLLAAFSSPSCKSGGKTEETKNDTVATADTVAMYKLNPELEILAPKFIETALPFVADKKLLEGIDQADSLTAAEVMKLSSAWAKGKMTNEISYTLEDFFRIDSIKQRGEYAAYVENLDIGNTKDSRAFALNRIKFSNENEAFIWAIQSSSYEACPYFSETIVFMTLISKGDVSDAYVIAESFGAGDPPVSMSRDITGEIRSEQDMLLSYMEEQDEDMDLPTVEITEMKINLSVKDGKLNVKEEAKKPYRVKRKAQEE